MLNFKGDNGRDMHMYLSKAMIVTKFTCALPVKAISGHSSELSRLVKHFPPDQKDQHNELGSKLKLVVQLIFVLEFH